MSEYNKCKCGETKTYISVSGNTCCSSCFQKLTKKIEPIINNKAIVIKDKNGWSVRINGELKKFFSKYEDYACTDAKNYAYKLNLGVLK